MTATAKTAKPTLVRVEDREGEGRCGACEREGLRWVCVLSDGTEVGTECAKVALGWKPTPKSYTWTADYTPVAEHTECAGTSSEVVWVLWQHKSGTATRMTRGGALDTVGGARGVWTQRGWAL